MRYTDEQLAPIYNLCKKTEIHSVEDNNAFTCDLIDDIREARRVAKNWEETAAQHLRNEDFYRGLLDAVAPWLGAAAYTADDGIVHDSPLRLKIPELVEALVRRVHAVVKEVASNDPESFADTCPVCGHPWWSGDPSQVHSDDCAAVALFLDLTAVLMLEPEVEEAPPEKPPKPDRGPIARGCQVRNTVTGSKRWVYDDYILANVLGSDQWVYDGPMKHWDGDYSYLCGDDYCRCTE
jgi:hypothetical protein